MATILGLDIGKKRIGSALSDAMGYSASPYKTFDLKGSLNSTLKEILSLCSEKKVSTLVIGYPLELDGSIGPQTKFTEKAIISFIKLVDPEFDISSMSFKLNQAIEIKNYKIFLIDERFTSVQAESMIAASHIRDEERRKLKDNISASILVQTYLDMRKES